MNRDARIFVAGEDTLLGRALVEELEAEGFEGLVGHGASSPDLRSRDDVQRFFADAKPEYVFLVAGRSGGISANCDEPADLMLDNLLVETSVLPAAHRHGVKKLLYMASSCSYPRDCPQPLFPEYLLGGPLEPTNEAYAVAKIAGIKLCEAYRRQHGACFLVGIPSNPFGPGDDFDLRNAHVIPALIRRLDAARRAAVRTQELWGSGRPRRDFIYSRDAASASIAVMANYDGEEPINIGCGGDVSIRELAELVADVVGFEGRIKFDTSKPDGMPLKLLDWQPLAELGWRPRWSLREAIEETHRDYLERFEVSSNPAQRKRASVAEVKA